MVVPFQDNFSKQPKSKKAAAKDFHLKEKVGAATAYGEFFNSRIDLSVRESRSAEVFPACDDVNRNDAGPITAQYLPRTGSRDNISYSSKKHRKKTIDHFSDSQSLIHFIERKYDPSAAPSRETKSLISDEDIVYPVGHPKKKLRSGTANLTKIILPPNSFRPSKTSQNKSLGSKTKPSTPLPYNSSGFNTQPQTSSNMYTLVDNEMWECSEYPDISNRGFDPSIYTAKCPSYLSQQACGRMNRQSTVIASVGDDEGRNSSRPSSAEESLHIIGLWVIFLICVIGCCLVILIDINSTNTNIVKK